MAVTSEMLLLVLPLVFFASLVDAISGGGGLISLPAYQLSGIPQDMVLGSNKFSASFGTLFACVKFLRSGMLKLWPTIWAMVGSAIGSTLGAMLAIHAPIQFIRIFMIIMVPVIAVIMFVKRDATVRPKPMTTTKLFGCFFIGLGCGFYDGFFGPGTGMFLIMLFTYAIGMDMVEASGTAKMANLASNVLALAVFIANGKVLFALTMPATICSILGGTLGAHLALKKGAKLIRYVMLGVLALLILKLVMDFFQ